MKTTATRELYYCDNMGAEDWECKSGREEEGKGRILVL